MDRRAVIAAALRNGQLLRVLAAFLVFNVAWWANWIAVLVWAYNWAGVRGASGVALAQLVPSALLATPAAHLFGRWPRAVALRRGYVAQALTDATLATSLVLDAPAPVVVGASVAGALAIVLTRPVHNALLPAISRTTGDLAAGNAASGTVEALGLVLGPLLCGLTIQPWGPGGVVVVMTVATAGAVVLTSHVVTSVESVPSTVPAPAPAVSPLRQVLRDPAARVLTTLVAAESMMIGLIDILVVVLALDLLDLPDSGPGLLNVAIGVGGLVGATATFLLVGRQRLGPALALAGLCTGLPFALAGQASSALVAAALLLACGSGKAFFEVTARTFLQRLLPDRLLTAVFGLMESTMMAGFAAGSLAAPLLVAAFGPEGAFLVAGTFLPVVALGSWSLLRRYDAEAEVPLDVLDRMLGVPMLSVLAPRIAERMACEAVPVTASKGERLITEGEPGDRFYVIDAGEVLVTRGGRTLRRLGEGDSFGELALLRDIPRTATVDCSSDVRLWCLERDSFLAAVAYCPEPSRRTPDYYR